MRRKFPVFLCFALLGTSLSAQTAATDNAADVAYNNPGDAPAGNGWINGDNGGSGFGAWTISTGTSSGIFIGDSTNNGGAAFAYYNDMPMPLTSSSSATGGINQLHRTINDNRSFGLWANGGQNSEATRALASPLQIGQTLRADMDNGFIQTGGSVGLILQDASGIPRLEVSFTGGNANYSVIGSTTQQTIHGYTGDGMRIQFQLVDADNYRLAIRFQDDASIEVFTGRLKGTAGAPIAAIRFFNHNAGAGSQYDLFFNNLAVTTEPAWQQEVFTGKVYDVDIGNLTIGWGALRIWIPDGVPTLRGIILYLNYGWSGGITTGDVRDFVGNIEWQAFCRNMGFALVATRQIASDTAGNESAAVETGLSLLGTMSGHPELSYAPIAPFGMSLGGASAYNYNRFNPLRTICFATNKSSSAMSGTLPASALNTPAMMIESENNFAATNQLTYFQTNRSSGALFGFLNEPRVAHNTGYSPNFIMKFFYNMIQQRCPTGIFPLAHILPLANLPETNGWLGDNSTWKNGIMSFADYASYSGDKRAASWLSDADSAFLWRAVGSYNQPIKLNTKNNLRVFRLGEPITVQCDTSALPAGWTKIEFFDGATKLGESSNTGLTWIEFTFTPSSSGIGGLCALATLGTGDKNTSNAARFVVRGNPPPPPVYSTWMASYGYIGASAVETADPDGDGNPNLFEYALSTNPSQPNPPGISVKNSADGALTLNYAKDTSKTDITYAVEWTNDLANAASWSTSGISESVLSTSGSVQQIAASIPRGSDARKFMRLRVTKP